MGEYGKWEKGKCKEGTDIRAARGGGEEGLEHVKVGEVELGEDGGRLVDARGRKGGAHCGAGEDIVHCLDIG
jgi:hypothetical protein